MKFKKKAYNVIFAILLIFVIGACSISTYVIATAPAVVIPDAENPDDNNPDNPDVNNPSLPQGPEVPSEPVAPEEYFDPNVPNFKYPLKIVNYALDKMFNSAGFHATCGVNLDVKASVVGSNVKINQKINGYVQASGNKSEEYLKFEGTGTLGTYAANYIRKLYMEDDKAYRLKTPKHSYDESEFYLTEYTKDQYYDRFGFSLAERPCLDFTTDKFSASLVLQKDKKGAEFYIITTTGIDASSFPERFMRFFESTNAIKNVKIKNASYTFYIYKNTAQIFKVLIDGNVTGVNPATGIDVECKVSANEVVTAYNQKIEIESPLAGEE